MANPNLSIFPYSTATDTTLTVASDNAETTLSAGISSSDTSINVTSAASFTVPCLIVIDGEIIQVAAKSTNTFTGCTRGFDGTIAATHTDTTSVFGYILAYHHNQMAAEMKSVSSYIFNADFTGFKTSENLLNYSEDFNQGYWSKMTGVTVSSNVAALPNGSTAFSLLEGSSSGINMISATPTGLIVGNTYTFSVYVKYVGSQWIAVGQNLAGAEARLAWFDVQNGLIGTVGALAKAAMVPIGNGFYRCMIVTTCTNLGDKTMGIALTSADDSLSYVGTTTNSNLICGASVRSGGLNGELSYIKTTGTSFSITSSGDLILDEGGLS